MKYCKYIKISKDNKVSSSNEKKDLYTIDLLYLDGISEKKSSLYFSELQECIKEMERCYKSSFFKLVSSNIVSFSNHYVEDLVIKQLKTDVSKSVSGDYDDNADWFLSVDKQSYNKYKLYMYNSAGDYNDNSSMIVNESQKELVVDMFIKTHDLSNYSLGMLIKNGRIRSSEDYIKSVKVLPTSSSIHVKYKNNQSEILDIAEFSNLLSEMVKIYNNSDDAFLQLYKDNKVDFEFSNNVNSYGKKVYSAKIKSNGDVILNKRKWLPLRTRINITKNPKDVFDAITSICYNNKKNFKDLVGNRITFATVKNKKTKKDIPKQIVFGKYFDTSIEPATVGYQYYAVYKDGYKRINKEEVVDYFNILARKKKIADKDIYRMFFRQYCKILPLDKVESYICNKEKSHLFNRFKSQNNKKKSSRKQKMGIIDKFGSFMKNVSKKLFGTPFKKLIASTTAVVIACSGGIMGLISKTSKEFKNDNSYSDNTDLLQDYTNDMSMNILDLANYDDLSISNNSYTKLLNRCTLNKNRKDAMQKVGSYLEKYNSKYYNNCYVHNFDEVFYEYLAYNISTGEKFNDILGEYNLDIKDFEEVMRNAIVKDAAGHCVQTDTIDKQTIIESTEGQALYKKYEDLFIEMNKEDSDFKKTEHATKFYDMVRADLPQISHNSYENVPGYMYIIEEFSLAMKALNVQTNNGFTKEEDNYIHGILNNVIIKELEKANTSNQSIYYFDEYNENSTVDLCPTIIEFRDASVLESKTYDNSDSPVLYYDRSISDKGSTNNLTFEQEEEDVNESFVQSNNIDYVSVNYDNNEVYDSSYNYDINDDYISSVEDSSVDVDTNVVLDNSSDTSYSTDSIVDGSINVMVECQIIDHYGDASSIVEGTLSSEDMIIANDGVVDSFDSESDSNTVDDFILDDEKLNNSFYNEGVVDEETVDNYEGIVSVPSDLEVYDQSDPLPDPNAMDSSSTNMSYEQIADLTVELMSSPINDSSYDVVYHL